MMGSKVRNIARAQPDYSLDPSSYHSMVALKCSSKAIFNDAPHVPMRVRTSAAFRNNSMGDAPETTVV